MAGLNECFHDIDPDANFYDSLVHANDDISNEISVEDYNFLCEPNEQYLSIIGHNTRSFNANKDSLLGMFAKDHCWPDVFVLYETWFTEVNTHEIQGYTSHHTTRLLGRSGGVSVYVRNSIYCEIIPLLSYADETIEICTVNITICKEKFTIIGIYRPHSDTINNFIHKLDSILNSNHVKYKNCIILGDLNINLLDDSNLTNSFITLLHSFRFLPCINVPTRYPASKLEKPSLLDHIWINKLSSFKSGVIMSDFTDHLPIYLKLSTKKNHNLDNKVKITFRLDNDTNRNIFYEKMTGFNWQSLASPNIDTYLQNFTSKLNLFYCESFPLKIKYVSIKKLINPWCTPDIQNLISLKSKYFQLLKFGFVTHEENKNFKNKVKKIIEKCKIEYYKKEFSKAKHDIKKTWNLIRNLSGNINKKPINKIVQNGVEFSTSATISEAFNSHFNSIANELDSKIPPPEIDPLSYVSRNQNSIFLYPVSCIECFNIVGNLKNTKPDLINLPVYMFTIFRTTLCNTIADIVNLSFTSGIFPSALKYSQIVPIHKKDDTTCLTNFRPISILPTLAKVFEKCLLVRLRDFIDKNNLLFKYQYGFTKMRSTEDAVIKFSELIYKSLNDKKFSISVFVDYSKAFDTVPHNILLSKLEKYGIRGTPLKLLKSYLSDRSHSTKINDVLSSPKIINIGLPQGSNLSPLLFILYINDLCNISDNFEKILFADDTTLIFSDTNYTSLLQNCNTELEKFNKWSIANRLSVNTAKTCYMLFTNRKIPNILSPIYLNNTEIQMESYVRFLGVIIDNNLKFNLHIQSICKKISKSIGIIYNIRNNTHKSCLKMMYYSLIYPYLSYCNLVWGKAYDSHIKPLEILQKRSIRIINEKSYLEHTLPLFYSDKILRLNDIYNFRLATFIFKNQQFIENYQYLHVHQTRHREDLRPSFQRLAVCKQAISFQGPKLWNEIPLSIKNSVNLMEFKSRFKSHVLSLYCPPLP